MVYIDSVVKVMPTCRPRHRRNLLSSKRPSLMFYHFKVGDVLLRVCKAMFLNTLDIGKTAVWNWKNLSKQNFATVTTEITSASRFVRMHSEGSWLLIRISWSAAKNGVIIAGKKLQSITFYLNEHPIKVYTNIMFLTGALHITYRPYQWQNLITPWRHKIFLYFDPKKMRAKSAWHIN